MIRGIDVSHYQGAVDWTGLKADHGLSFGAAKCSEGLAFVDSQFKRNWAGMKSAGLRRISYHYATPSASSARAQAARHVALTDPQPGDALCLDLEKSSLGQSSTNAWMRAYGDALHDLAPGITTIAYLGGYAANGSGQSAVDHFDHWWYPRYPGPTGWPTTFAPRLPAPNTTGFRAPKCPSIWQFTPNKNGMDANVSDLTITELFDNGDNMPTVQEYAAAAAKAVWAELLQVNTGGQTSAENWLVQANVGAKDARAAALAGLAILQDPSVFVAAVVAALPPASTGGLSVADVEKAVRNVLTNGIGATS